ncbi:MAG: terpene cyclase/mutase family protein [Kiritimatiellaeota bacterium]|nr:terpene cyclase/mutase family protein [Kiritimatiellota bacterium]
MTNPLDNHLPPDKPKERLYQEVWGAVWRQRSWMGKAITLSILLHFCLGVGSVFIVIIRSYAKPQAQFTATPSPRPALEPHKLEMRAKVQDLQKSSARPRLQPRLVALRPSDLALPEMKKIPDTVNRRIQRDISAMGLSGFGQGVGGGYGTGIGGGGMGGSFMKLPLLLAARCDPAARIRRLAEHGGTPQCDAAVVKALTWLAGQQNSDGSWGQAHRTAMTGLALLAFLGHCELPDSPRFGPHVRKAIRWLVNQGGRTPIQGNTLPYEHGIATYALAEAYSLTREPEIASPLKIAIGTIIKGQTSDGGWVYNYGSQGIDMSITGWQVQALKAVQVSGLTVEGLEKSLDRAMLGIKASQAPNGHWRYQKTSGPTPSLTGTGAYCLQIWKQGKSPEVRHGIQAILAGKGFSFTDKNYGLYTYYYYTMACFNRGGDPWNKWRNGFQGELLKAQNSDGSWPAEGAGGAASSSAAKGDAGIYRTCLCTLMLEVYYRYLPSSS